MESKTYNYFPKETTQCISLSVDMPNKFDVIDASKICDNNGLLNVLLTCEPLLANNSHSIINTEFMSTIPTNDSLNGFLEEELCCSTNTFAKITGLVLSESYSFTTEKLTNLKARMNYNISEQKCRGNSMNCGSVIAFTWRHSLPKMKYSCSSPETFVSMLLSLYKRIFKLQYDSGNMIELMDNFEKNSLILRTGSNSFAFPLGYTFVRLIKYAKENMLDITDGVIEDLLKAMAKTGFFVQSNYYQELNVWCTKLGVLPPSV
eukprot:gene3013-5903_t